MRNMSLHISEAGASEVVGEMLMLSITASLFVLLSVATYSMVTSQPSAPIMNIGLGVQNGKTLVFQHEGGDSVAYNDLKFVVNNVEYNTSSSLSVGDSNGNGAWDVGETVTISLAQAPESITAFVYDKQSNSMLDSFTYGG